jgi:chromosome segregation ATPase
VILLPRKKFDYEKLAEEARKLRDQNLTYRQTAEKLGCSPFTVHQVLNPKPKDAARRVDELSLALASLEQRLSLLENALSYEAKSLEKVRLEISNLNRNFEELRTQLLPLDRLKDEVRTFQRQLQNIAEANKTTDEKIKNTLSVTEELKANLSSLQNLLKLVEDNMQARVEALEHDIDLMTYYAKERFESKEYQCKHADKEGYCTRYKWRYHNVHLNMKEVKANGEKAYLVNVRLKPIICAACPAYQPKGKHRRIWP